MEHLQIIFLRILIRSAYKQDVSDETYKCTVRQRALINLVIVSFCGTHSAIRRMYHGRRLALLRSHYELSAAHRRTMSLAYCSMFSILCFHLVLLSYQMNWSMISKEFNLHLIFCLFNVHTNWNIKSSSGFFSFVHTNSWNRAGENGLLIILQYFGVYSVIGIIIKCFEHIIMIEKCF